MSALQFRKASVTELGSDPCTEEGCNRKGRYAVAMAGYPVLPASPIAFSHQAVLCPKHARAWERLWAELNGSEALKDVQTAVQELGGSTPKRIDGIEALRELGCTRDEIAVALKATGERESVDQIIEKLVESTEPMAVAA
jgi:hypothetical protein